MALTTDKAYILHSLRLHHLRGATDPHSARIISLSSSAFTENAYIRGSGLADVDLWPEIAAALDSPPLEIDRELALSDGEKDSDDEVDDLERIRQRRWKGKQVDRSRSNEVQPLSTQGLNEQLDPNVGLKYSRTIGNTSMFQPGMRVDSRPAVSRPTPARGDSSVATSVTATPTARARTAMHDTPAMDAWATPKGSRDSNFETRRNRHRAFTTDEIYSAESSATTPRTPLDSSMLRTPVARALTGVSRATPTTQSMARLTRPRADSAPVVVISSPSGRDERISRHSISSGDGLEDATQTPVAKPRASSTWVKSRRITSMMMLPAHQEDTAFSPAAISSVLDQPYEEGTGYNFNLRNNGQVTDVPPAGADPHRSVMQAQYGSILEQAMMSQSVVTGITDNSGIISSSGMGTSYGNGFDQIYEEDEEDDGENDGGRHRGNPDRKPPGFRPRSVLTGLDLAPDVSLGSMGGLSGLNTRANSEASSQEGDGLKRLSENPRRTTMWSDTSASEPAIFEKRQTPVSATVSGGLPKISGLAMLLRPTGDADEGDMGNPFARYVSVPPPQGSSLPSLELQIYFPFSRDPFKPLRVVVRKDVAVEELIGWSLHQYLEEDRAPGLEENHDKGPNRSMDPEVWYSTTGWALRMVEDDGEVDEDFPALDRESQVSKFSFGSFAVVEATPSQIEQSLVKQPLKRSGRATPQIQSTSQLSPAPTSPNIISGSASPGQSFPPPALGAPSRNGLLNSPAANGYGGLSASLKSAAVGGVPVALKVRVILASDLQFSTSISVPSEMYFADITETLIRKKNLNPPDPAEWVLVLGDLSMVLPLDRTVESLMGSVQLALLRKGWAQAHGLAVGKAHERLGGDPSTSIFQRRVDISKQVKSRADLTSTYKKFIVQRKMPIGRHERILAIDGDYIHIMPTDNKAFFDSMKTSSFHVTSIVSCKQSSKTPTNFKIVVWRDDAEKRYDFETDSSRQAAEIISALRELMKMYESERANLIPAQTSRPSARHRLRRH